MAASVVGLPRYRRGNSLESSGCSGGICPHKNPRRKTPHECLQTPPQIEIPPSTPVAQNERYPAALCEDTRRAKDLVRIFGAQKRPGQERACYFTDHCLNSAWVTDRVITGFVHDHCLSWLVEELALRFKDLIGYLLLYTKSTLGSNPVPDNKKQGLLQPRLLSHHYSLWFLKTLQSVKYEKTYFSFFQSNFQGSVLRSGAMLL